MDGRHLRGAYFPEFTVFIPKNREYLAQISVRSTRKKLRNKKFQQAVKLALRGAKLTFEGGNKSYRGRKKLIRKTNKKVATFYFIVFFGDSKNLVLCIGAPFKFSAAVRRYSNSLRH